jgi:hypothetical protein
MNEKARTAEKDKVSPKNIRGLDKILPLSGDSVGFLCLFVHNINVANLTFFNTKRIFFLQKTFCNSRFLLRLFKIVKRIFFVIV